MVLRPASLFVVSATLLATPCAYFVRTVPVILLNDGSNSTRLEVSAGPGATAVTWQATQNLPFKVNGQSLCGKTGTTSFNLTQSGGLFTLDNIQFDPAPACRNNGVLSEPNGIMSGFFEYNIGSIVTTTASGSTTLNLTSGYYFPMIVVEAQMYRSLDSPTQIDANTQQTAWLINVRDDALQVESEMQNFGTPPANSSSAVINLSRALTDGYDFRGFVSSTTTACDAGRTQGLHFVVQSNTTGNGEHVGSTTVYQTGPKLLGLTFHANFIMGSTGVIYHETMHQWGAYLDQQQLGVDDANSHWLPNSSVGGALGGCAWTDNGNGTFSIAPRQLVDGDLELYVAGLLPASRVTPVYVAGGVVNGCNAGAAVPSPYKKVTIDDVIRVHGPRTPAFDGVVKNYKYAMVVTSQNRLLSPLEMTYYGRIAQLWEGNTVELGVTPPYQWTKYTRGQSTLSTVLDSWNGPLVRAAAVTNAASGKVAAISPGEIIVLYGLRMGPANLSGLSITGGKVDSITGGTRVLFDGIPAAMLYSSSGQVSAIVPYEVQGHVAVSIQVEYQGRLSPAISLPVVQSAPGIFTQDQSGRGAGSILNQDNSINTASNPAAADTVIQIFGTGEGQSNPPNTDGAITPDVRPSQQSATVTIGGLPANIQFAGPAPFAIAGLFQVNAFVPQGLPPGPAAVSVKFGTATSQDGVVVFVK